MWLNRIVPGVMVAAVLCGALVSGCSSEPKRLATGTVDTAVILKFDDEYNKLAQQYFKERVIAAAEVKKAVAQQGGKLDEASYERFAMKEVELNNKWSQKTRDYVSKKLDSIKDVCAKVAEKKQLDLVLIDSADAPSVEYGGVDISGDILGELPGMAGAGQVDSSSGSGETVEGSK